MEVDTIEEMQERFNTATLKFKEFKTLISDQNMQRWYLFDFTDMHKGQLTNTVLARAHIDALEDDYVKQNNLNMSKYDNNIDAFEKHLTRDVKNNDINLPKKMIFREGIVLRTRAIFLATGASCFESDFYEWAIDRYNRKMGQPKKPSTHAAPEESCIGRRVNTILEHLSMLRDTNIEKVYGGYSFLFMGTMQGYSCIFPAQLAEWISKNDASKITIDIVGSLYAKNQANLFIYPTTFIIKTLYYSLGILRQGKWYTNASIDINVYLRQKDILDAIVRLGPNIYWQHPAISSADPSVTLFPQSGYDTHLDYFGFRLQDDEDNKTRYKDVIDDRMKEAKKTGMSSIWNILISKDEGVSIKLTGQDKMRFDERDNKYKFDCVEYDTIKYKDISIFDSDSKVSPEQFILSRYGALKDDCLEDWLYKLDNKVETLYNSEFELDLRATDES